MTDDYCTPPRSKGHVSPYKEEAQRTPRKKLCFGSFGSVSPFFVPSPSSSSSSTPVQPLLSCLPARQRYASLKLRLHHGDAQPDVQAALEHRLYSSRSPVGQGSFGIVYRVEYLQCVFAVKEQECRTDKIATMQVERIRLLQQRLLPVAAAEGAVSHWPRALVRVYGVWVDAERVLYTQMQFCEERAQDVFASRAAQGTLQQAALELLHQVGEALGVLAQHSLLHMDVKPDNVRYSTQRRCFQLVDFDTLLDLAEPEPDIDTEGDRDFLAPEVLQNRRDALRGAASDVYALGRTLQNLCMVRSSTEPRPASSTSANGDDDNEEEEEQENVEESAANCLVYSEQIQPAFRAFLQRMVQRDPALRPSAQEVAQFAL